MKSIKIRFIVLALLAGVLSACASPPANTPVSQPTQASVPATQAPATAPPTATDPSTAATEAPAAAAGAAVSFANDILPLLQSRCVNCHGGQKTEKGLTLNSYAGVMTGSENGPVVAPGAAADSTLSELVSKGKMPKRGPKLTPGQVALIVDWINQGAQNN